MIYTSRAFFSKIRPLFLIFEKGQGRPLPPSSCAPATYVVKWRRLETHMITDEFVAPRIDTLATFKTEQVCAIIYAVFRICKNATICTE